MTLSQLHKAADKQVSQAERFLREGKLTLWMEARQALQGLEDRIKIKELA